MSGADDQMARGTGPAQPRPVPVRQVQSVNGDNRGGADRRSFLHGLFLDLHPPLLSDLVQFEQRPNERPLPTRGRGAWARRDGNRDVPDLGLLRREGAQDREGRVGVRGVPERV